MIYLTVLLYVKKGKEKVFVEYENAVLPILKEHNGVLIHRLRPLEENYIGTSTEEQPYEIHLISFASDQHFKAYLQDSKRASFDALKNESLRLSYIYKGEKL
ncbi:DUF1330 domain-containing protein [Wenyingzhuangia aestuarii]|uniref:DUF1330 domain-containing protein n=1 Tax=Wenyingzhuangia aestuarii TaxID=1647582 RepID=UPI00143A5ADC|nr:DUF1330 domain-containing protein [Wenyingzhuangia aestuarii]NJB83091.1 hypothetical protein [Wenyingzhuangia aestuarii]